MASRLRRKRKDSRPSYKDRCPACKHGRIVMARSGGAVLKALRLDVLPVGGPHVQQLHIVRPPR